MRELLDPRLLTRPSVLIGLVIVTVLLVCALGAPWIAPYDPFASRPAEQFLPPVWADGGTTDHLLGTDQLGRDLTSRMLYGARTSLAIAGAAVVLSGAFGAVVGLFAGYFRGPIETVIMRLADVQLAFPFILLALAILSVTETKSVLTMITVLAIADWVIHARVSRGRVLVERERDYVRAARALGSSHLRIAFRYILPTVLPTLLVIVLVEMALLMVVEAILAFIGLGIDPPGLSWGTIMADGRTNIAVAPWMAMLPGMAIFLSVLGVNLVADGLSDVLNPRLRGAGRIGEGAAVREDDQQTLEAPRSVTTTDASNGAASGPDNLLVVDGLRVEFPGPDGSVVAVQDVGFELAAGERLGIVGESGSGKSMTALSIIGLIEAPGRVTAGSIKFKGRELVGLPPRAMNRIRGSEIAMIFQDPATSLNPTLTVSYQIAEVIARHQQVSRKVARRKAVESLELVNINDPQRVAGAYPFQLSGGMQQRVMIAMALSCNPDLLIADEPTTALDVTTQAQILSELDTLVQRLNTGIILITHDLGLIAEFTERTVVMRDGLVCEVESTGEIVNDPKHPYTQSLLQALMDLNEPDEAPRGR
ncbi:MAG TPA: dipeptide/oligopeptide/nickel ABC transporter permease/ATP-binding protein [Gemmatimonadales bacterium]|nr:dipeptide/oligopeptide/nickel ABC transporter permease/ATP-binding protein [Gemmatimonadales bacterium]